jgi:hypothetical protein
VYEKTEMSKVWRRVVAALGEKTDPVSALPECEMERFKKGA